MPQGRRTPAEKADFHRMLPRINLLYIGCSALLLVDGSYQSRFWTQCEAWFSMQTCTATGLIPAVGAAKRRGVAGRLRRAEEGEGGGGGESLVVEHRRRNAVEEET